MSSPDKCSEETDGASKEDIESEEHGVAAGNKAVSTSRDEGDHTRVQD